MKKYGKYFSMLLVSLLLLTGCGEKKLTPKEEVDKALKNIQELTSLTIGASVNLKMTVDGATVEMPITVVARANETAEDTGLVAFHVNQNPFMGEADLYVDVAKEESTVYMPSSLIASFAGLEEEENYWIKQVVKNEEIEETDSVDISALTEKIEKLDFSKILTDDDLVLVDETDDEKHYTLNMTQDLIARIAKELGEEGTSEDELEGTLKVEIYVNTKESHLTKISIDLVDFLKSNASQMTDEDLGIDLSTVSKCEIELTFTDYNTTTVTIPEEVKTNAITIEEYSEKLEEQYE